MKKSISLLLMFGIVSGCAVPSAIESRFYDPVSVSLVTEGVTIEANDGSFTYSAGSEYTNFPLIGVHTGWGHKNCRPNDSSVSFMEKLISNQKASLVTLKFDDGAPDLYGALIVCSIFYELPGNEHLKIEIPPQHITEAREGELSAFYGSIGQASGFEQVAWLMWLSNAPLAE